MILAFVAFAAFVIVSMSVFFQSTSEADQQSAENTAIALYLVRLDAYQAQIDNFVDCRRSVQGREDLKQGIFRLYDFIIDIGQSIVEAGGSSTLLDKAVVGRNSFNADFEDLDPGLCVLPTAPSKPDDLPSNIPFDVPEIPAEFAPQENI
jgi:hypothetical protein